jgi:ABC-2 type transport system ATP-binding protein
MNTPALLIKHLTKKYGKFVAVDNISFSIDKGEFFGFLGPNGAGKTTTIKCITGIATFDEGNIKLFDIDVVKDYREARKKVGLSPQEFNIDFFGRVWKILDYVGGYYGMPKKKRRERVDELLEQFELKDHKDKEFRTLSGGLKRRVALARAMVHDPEILILDEPTAGVDVELRHELWRHLRKLNEFGKTIFLTSHYLEEVEMLCDRVAIINNGKIVSDLPKEDYIKDGKKLEDMYLEITGGKVNYD